MSRLRLLQALELNGFKSFANKTTLDLSHGITAVVGPNGSGKSNVIDAIRWLLGERDARNLRGGKGEDLIFAGTRERPRLGLGQATLYFSNDNKFFPVDYPEIAVSRQINRQNESRYFINKSEVRLKDLVDFFAQSRLGARGLVVVTQGNSDVFIKAAPAERRAMIEEILGLREYQLKKTEAERRLDHATVNLEKVKALTEELLPHLRSLKRQTSRWEKREEVASELRGLEDQYYGTKLASIVKEEKELEKEINIRNEEKKNLDQSYKEAQSEVHRVEQREPEERAELIKIKDGIKKLGEDRALLAKQVMRLEIQIESEEGRNHSNNLPSAQLIKILQETKTALEESLLNQSQLIESVQTVIKNIEKFLSGNHQEGKVNLELEKEVKKVEESLLKLDADLKKLTLEENRLTENQGQFYADFKNALHKLDQVKNRIDDWQRGNQQTLVAKERLLFQRQELEKSVTQNGRLIEEFHKKESNHENLEEIEHRILKLRGHLASIGDIDEAILKEAKATEERYSYLEKEIADLEKSKADLKNLIQELKSKIKHDFGEALNKINKEFASFFEAMFGGGYGKLVVPKPSIKKMAGDEDTEDPTQSILETKEVEEGIEIELKLPRKKVSSLEMLSGGERSLVGIAALFALISVSPPPFLVLDEVDAALDERNAKRFAELVKKFAHETQFVIVTHNRATMEAAEVLYGVTMHADGTSKIVSLKLE
ncbi:MAG: AAA family ATPase [Anaplasmataceae bacterium]|nr:AAA family ATPase [Anaplasmataceae bacterium]